MSTPDNGLTILLTTHDMHEAESLCNRVAIIIDGRFVTIGKPASLLHKYRKLTLEEVFLEITGQQWKEVDDEP
jgi:ABC-2 type transport system ATP-binding protein